MALSRLKHGFESRRGRHHTYYPAEQFADRADAAYFIGVSTRRAGEWANEQLAKDLPALHDIPLQQGAPIDEPRFEVRSHCRGG